LRFGLIASAIATRRSRSSARPFFERRGFRVLAEQQVTLTNYRMEKALRNPGSTAVRPSRRVLTHAPQGEEE